MCEFITSLGVMIPFCLGTELSSKARFPNWLEPTSRGELFLILPCLQLWGSRAIILFSSREEKLNSYNIEVG